MSTGLPDLMGLGGHVILTHRTSNNLRISTVSPNRCLIHRSSRGRFVLTWRLMSERSPYLNQAMLDELFEFVERTLSGILVNRA